MFRQRAGHLDQEQPANGVVAAIVGVFEIVPVPVMRVGWAILAMPEMSAVDTVAEELGPHVDQGHIFVSLRKSGENLVVRGDDLQALGPSRQPRELDVPVTIGRVVDVDDDTDGIRRGTSRAAAR